MVYISFFYRKRWFKYPTQPNLSTRSWKCIIDIFFSFKTFTSLHPSGPLYKIENGMVAGNYLEVFNKDFFKSQDKGNLERLFQKWKRCDQERIFAAKCVWADQSEERNQGKSGWTNLPSGVRKLKRKSSSSSHSSNNCTSLMKKRAIQADIPMTQIQEEIQKLPSKERKEKIEKLKKLLRKSNKCKNSYFKLLKKSKAALAQCSRKHHKTSGGEEDSPEPKHRCTDTL